MAARLSDEEKRRRKAARYRDWYSRNRDYVNAQKRKWYAENREKQREYFKNWNRQNPERVQAYRLARKYGITLEQAEKLRVEQKGRCALCDKGDTKLCLDHDHQTGRIRGFLCVRCNNALGAIGDNEEGARRVLAYVTKPPAL